jgi:hypothetical protein
LLVDASYVERMKGRLANMRKIQALAHDPRIVEIVRATADELEQDIRKLEAEAAVHVSTQIN